MFSPLSVPAFLDSWALHALVMPRVYGGERLDADATIAYATALSRTLFGGKHSTTAAHALVPLIEEQGMTPPSVLSRRQMHVLIAVAASDLLERDQLARFLNSYRDPGLDLCYRPVSVTALRAALREVLGSYPSAKRTRLLCSLAERSDGLLLLRAPIDAPLAPEFMDAYRDYTADVFQVGLAQRVALSVDEQYALARHSSWQVRKALVTNSDLDSAVVADLIQIEDDSRVLVSLAENRKLSVRAQERLAVHSSVQVRRMLARNSQLAPSAQRILVRDRDVTVRENLARCECALIDDVQEALAQMRANHIPFALSQRSDLLESIQLRFARHPDPQVRVTLARRPTLSRAVQLRLAQSRNARVLESLTRSPSLIPEVQTRLARHRQALVRCGLAQNPALTYSVFGRLALDHSDSVRVLLAGNRALPPALQMLLARDGERKVRLSLATNRNLSFEVQLQLANDREPHVRLQLAQAQDLTEAVLLALAQDSRVEVRSWIACRAALPDTVRDVLEHDSDPRIHELVRNGPSSESSALRGPLRICDIDDPATRFGLALDPATPHELRALNHDGIARILEAATVLRMDVRTRPSDVKDAASMPGFDDLEFPSAANAQAHLDRVGLRVRFFRNGRETKLAGRLMANCLAGGAHTNSARAGQVLVAELDVDGVRYHAAWRYCEEAVGVELLGRSVWERFDLAGPNNDHQIPIAVRRLARTIGKLLRDVRPEPGLKIPARREIMESLSLDAVSR